MGPVLAAASLGLLLQLLLTAVSMTLSAVAAIAAFMAFSATLGPADNSACRADDSLALQLVSVPVLLAVANAALFTMASGSSSIISTSSSSGSSSSSVL